MPKPVVYIKEKLQQQGRGPVILTGLWIAGAVLFFVILIQPEESHLTVRSFSPVEETATVLVTAEQIAQLSYTDRVLGQVSWTLSEESLGELNRVLEEYGICTPEEISQFLAQATVETAAGIALTESGDEEYFQRFGYTTGTRGAGYLHLTHEYGQMAFAVWMMKKYVPELSAIEYCNPGKHSTETVSRSYYSALRLAADLGVNISKYSRIVYDEQCPLTTGADYIAEEYAWESAGYYWHIAGIGDALSTSPGTENTDIASDYVGGSNRESRREAYLAFYPILYRQESKEEIS